MSQSHSENIFKALEVDYYKFKPRKIVKELKQNHSDKLVRFLLAMFKKNINIQPHNTNERTKRDSFLSEIKAASSDQKIREKIDKLQKLCVCAEKIYDAIKLNLSNLAISKKSPEIQCWAVIRRAQNEILFLKDETKKHLENIDQGSRIYDVSSAFLQNSEGEYYSPDAVITKTVDYLSLTLKMFSFNHKLNNGNLTIIPDAVEVEEEDLEDAGRIFSNSILWFALESAVETCLLFEYELNEYNSTNLPEGLEDSGLDVFYAFELTKDMFIRADFISNERLYSKLSQNFIEAMYKYNIHKTVDDSMLYLSTLDNGRSVTVSEFPAYVALLETLCLSDENMLISGLTLREWVRCYSTLEKLAKLSEKKEIYTFSELNAIFLLVGISSDKSKTFIDHVSFNIESRDLYDSPLLKLKSGNYLFCSVGYFSPGISNIILSQFSSLKVDLSKKGFGFEKEMHDMLSDLKMNYQHFKFKRGTEEYEYDAIVVLDDKVFVLECKNTNLSGGSVNKAYKKKVFFIETAQQVKRLVQGLKDYPDVFQDKFNLDIRAFEVIPVIVNNLPFSLPGKFNDVYITDFSALSKILHNSHIGGIRIQNNNGELESSNTPLHRLWESETLQASDLINQFERPIQLSEFFNSTVVARHSLPISHNTAFGISSFEGDIDRLKEYRRERIDSIYETISVTE